jgi:hypothetical protein
VADGEWFPRDCKFKPKMSASCAEHETAVREFLKTIPEARQLRLQHCVNVWNAYAGYESRYREPGGCKARKAIDQSRVQAALDA